MAVVRVKRRLDEDAAEALVVAYKRPKKEENEETKCVFKFVGTVNSQNEDLAPILESGHRKRQLNKHHKADIRGKARNETRSQVEENRLKVVNAFRCLDEDSTLDNTSPDVKTGGASNCAKNNGKSLRVCDVTTTELNAPKEEEKFVYDVYMLDELDFDDRLLDYVESVYAWGSDVFVNMEHEEEDPVGEDEDSNSESNWRNDYPDCDPDSECDSRQGDYDDHPSPDYSRTHYDDEFVSDVTARLRHADLDDDDEELSSLSGDSFDEDVQEFSGLNVQRYGTSYARYRARVTREMEDYENEEQSGASSEEKT